MKKILFAILAFGAIHSSLQAQEADTASIDYAAIEKSLKYQTGNITLQSGHATVKVPNGFRFLDAKDAQYVLKDLWGNPEDSSVLGALVPENTGVTQQNSWLFVIGYEEMGFVKDDDAQDINYDDLLAEMKTDTEAANAERTQLGFDTASLMGWASKPYYDDQLKVLHWAKEIKFGQSPNNTLNYDLRVLGRKGVVTLSAVASMEQLPMVKNSIPGILNSVNFDQDYAYADFDSSTDTVAAWTIGGLVAGKVLAKAGFFAILLKFGKFIVVGLIAAFAALKKFVFNKKEHEVTRPVLAEVSPTEEKPEEQHR